MFDQGLSNSDAIPWYLYYFPIDYGMNIDTPPFAPLPIPGNV